MELVREIKDYKIIIGLIALQLLVTLPFISSAPISIDEPFSIFYAQQDIEDMMGVFMNENNPPLHFVLLHYWINLFGISPGSVRSLSLLFSVLTIPILFQFGKKILNKKFSILLIGFFIFSTFNHYHALEARVYSLMVLLTVLIFDELCNMIFYQKFSFLKLACWNALLMYSHYLGGVVVIVELVVLVMFSFKLTKKKIISFIFSGLISLLLYSPVLVIFIERIGDFSKNGTWVARPMVSELYGNVVRFFNGKYSTLFIAVVISAIVFYNRNLILKDKLKGLFSHKNIFAFSVFGFSYFGMYLFSILKQHIFIDRYLLFTSPFLFISFLILLKYLIFKKENSKLIIFLVFPMIVFCNYVPNTDRDPDSIADFITDFKTENSHILICPPFYDLTFLYHFDRKSFIDYKSIDLNSNIHSIYSLDGDLLNSLKLIDGSVFFVDAKSKFLFPDNDILGKLKNKFSLDSEKEFKGGYVVYQFSNFK